MKVFGIAIAVASAAMGMASAEAATFTLAGGSAPFTFEIADSLDPDVWYQGVQFVIYDVQAPSASGFVDVTFYNGDWFSDEMRSLQIEDYREGVSLFELYGPQLYSGPESAPSFSSGVFTLTNAAGRSYSLTITTAAAAVPEPATWAMFIGGFGLVGGAMRRRPVSVRFT